MLPFLFPAYFLSLIATYYTLVWLGASSSIAVWGALLVGIPLGSIISWLSEQLIDQVGALVSDVTTGKIDAPWWVEAEALEIETENTCQS
ncbi:hypothetical protein EON83_20875 [bacterium]|nr:MAG: hypothetical protein EON83_20875 [bacterium]